MNGKEFSTVEKHEIAALIEALCEAPLVGEVQVSAEMQALRREAAKMLIDAAGTGADNVADADRLTAALAALLSGPDSEAARRALADPAVRLDAESALAFVDAVEQSAEVAPAHLVEELVSAAAVATPRSGAAGLWLRIANGFWPAQRWRMVAACAVMLVASAAAWSLFWEAPNQVANPPASVAKTENANSAPSTLADAPAAPRPALAARQPCEPAAQAGASAVDERRSLARARRPDGDAGGGCSSAPGNEFADTTIKEALEKAELARRAAAERAAAAAKVGTMQADPELDRKFGAAASRPALSAPAALPAAPPAAAPGLR